MTQEQELIKETNTLLKQSRKNLEKVAKILSRWEGGVHEEMTLSNWCDLQEDMEKAGGQLYLNDIEGNAIAMKSITYQEGRTQEV